MTMIWLSSEGVPVDLQPPRYGSWKPAQAPTGHWCVSLLQTILVGSGMYPSYSSQIPSSHPHMQIQSPLLLILVSIQDFLLVAVQKVYFWWISCKHLVAKTSLQHISQALNGEHKPGTISVHFNSVCTRLCVHANSDRQNYFYAALILISSFTWTFICWEFEIMFCK